MREGKTLDAVIESAFYAGVKQGEAADESPYASDREAYLAWRDQWTGRPHEVHDGATENPPCDRPHIPQPTCHLGRELRYHAQPCAPGCNYPPLSLPPPLPEHASPGHYTVVTHRFDPGITGMSSMCNQLVVRDGDTTECDLPRSAHIKHYTGNGGI